MTAPEQPLVPIPPRVTPMALPTPTGDQLKAARVAAGLSQAQAAELMGYPLQTGSRGGVQSRTWQALESPTDERNMQSPVFALFLLLTGQHPGFCLLQRTGGDHGAGGEGAEAPSAPPGDATGTRLGK
ncbi:helix-turn-helix domain-containing protein [Acidovorax radicis]|uniref:helix-turn-helix domain-containing protein n=1 Tax=Acidovorax radicis TaxID=758826 RepID=UPI001CF8D1B7|nr:helix-turn-helix transcriptional regulator [Acidovorax radicis]